MKIKRRKRMHMGVEASSLADILFFLMLFFLMVSTLASNNALGLLLPESRTGKVVPKEVINISIDDKLQYYVDSRKVTFEEYESSLAARSTNTKDIT
ncbi:MAG: biopolymer transporter ExbD, partial [Cytophagales bacterium]|nr:biopolymer transporter ExbD [Cytophaga sp.]